MENVLNRIRLKSKFAYVIMGFFKKVESDCYGKGLMFCKGFFVFFKINFWLNLKRE